MWQVQGVVSHCLKCLRQRFADNVGMGLGGREDNAMDDEVRDMYADCKTLDEIKNAES